MPGSATSLTTIRWFDRSPVAGRPWRLAGPRPRRRRGRTAGRGGAKDVDMDRDLGGGRPLDSTPCGTSSRRAACRAAAGPRRRRRRARRWRPASGRHRPAWRHRRPAARERRAVEDAAARADRTRWASRGWWRCRRRGSGPARRSSTGAGTSVKSPLRPGTKLARMAFRHRIGRVEGLEARCPDGHLHAGQRAECGHGRRGVVGGDLRARGLGEIELRVLDRARRAGPGPVRRRPAPARPPRPPWPAAPGRPAARPRGAIQAPGPRRDRPTAPARSDRGRPWRRAHRATCRACASSRNTVSCSSWLSGPKSWLTLSTAGKLTPRKSTTPRCPSW